MRFVSEAHRRAVMASLMGQSRKIPLSPGRNLTFFSKGHRVYHGTSSAHLPSILKKGLRAGTYFGRELRYPMVEAHRAVEKAGGKPIILAIPVRRLHRRSLRADRTPPTGWAVRYMKRVSVNKRNVRRVVERRK